MRGLDCGEGRVGGADWGVIKKPIFFYFYPHMPHVPNIELAVKERGTALR